MRKHVAPARARFATTHLEDHDSQTAECICHIWTIKEKWCFELMHRAQRQELERT